MCLTGLKQGLELLYHPPNFWHFCLEKWLKMLSRLFPLKSINWLNRQDNYNFSSVYFSVYLASINIIEIWVQGISKLKWIQDHVNHHHGCAETPRMPWGPQKPTPVLGLWLEDSWNQSKYSLLLLPLLFDNLATDDREQCRSRMWFQGYNKKLKITFIHNKTDVKCNW